MELLKSLTKKSVVIHLVGNSQVGKSNTKNCLENLYKICLKTLSPSLDLNSKNQPNVSIVIGNPSFNQIISYNQNTSHILIYLYDITNEESFKDASKQSKSLFLPSSSSSSSSSFPYKFRKILVGNKIDLEYWRKVSVKSGLEAALEIGCEFCEISCHTGMHIDYIMDVILKEIFGDLKSLEIRDILSKLNEEINSIERERAQEIEEISNTLKKLNEISLSINNEIQNQSLILDDLDEEVDSIGLVSLKDKSQKKSRKKTESIERSEKVKTKHKDQSKSSSISSQQPRVDILSSSSLDLFSSPTLPSSSSSSSSSSSLSQSISPPPTFLSPSQISSGVKRKSSSPRLYEPQSSPLQQQMKMEMIEKEEIGESEDEEEEDQDNDNDDRVMNIQQNILVFDESLNIQDKFPTEDSYGQSTPRLKRISNEIEDVKSIMHENMETVIQRQEKLEQLVNYSDNLLSQSQTFKRNSKQLKQKKMFLNFLNCICCCPCIAVTFLWNTYKKLSKKAALFDNVLADTENAFQTLAKLLVYLQEWTEETLHPYLYLLFGWLFNFINSTISFLVVLVSTIVLILPSFFTLLIVRTKTIEKESKAFGVRQEVIRHEKKEQSALRWFRIILRSLPMSFYILGLPYVLVYHVFEKDPKNKRVITISLVCYLCGVILLQILGSIRAYYSWKSRDIDIPKAPSMYYEEEIKESKDGIKSFLKTCCSSSKSKSKSQLRLESEEISNRESNLMIIKKKTNPPFPPNTFSLKNPMNLIELLSLTLEFFQMASFSLQTNPYESNNDNSNNNSPTQSPTQSPSGFVEESYVDSIPDFWGKKLFQILYVHFPVESDIRLILMWGAIVLVLLLITLFSLQFLVELRVYGSLMKDVENKDKAKDSFFYSFTGSIVYGHGKPNNISSKLRLLVSILSDALFLIISLQLLQVVSCEYDNDNGNNEDDNHPTLRGDSSFRCWEGQHSILATISLMCYGFYVPLSIMITPMLLEAPKKNSTNGDTVVDPGVSYLKLYLMTINVVKSIMLLVGSLGPQVVFTAVLSSTIASFILGSITYTWFQRNNYNLNLQDKTNTTNHNNNNNNNNNNNSISNSLSIYSADLHPCNIAFINYWKAASYTASVTSAIIVLIAYRMNKDQFPVSSLTYCLIITWVIVIIVFGVLYYRFYKSTSSRKELLEELINYPFYFRDIREELFPMVVNDNTNNNTNNGNEGNFSLWLIQNSQIQENKKHIPGFKQSPWFDMKHKTSSRYSLEDYDGKTFTSELTRYGRIKGLC